jgi:hypothetical protein
MKPKILGMKTESYSGGRIDSFTIDEEGGTWATIASCLVSLGFNEDDIKWRIDTALEDRGGYLFLYLSKKLKVHLHSKKSEDSFTVRLDTSLPRKIIIDTFDSFYELP